MESCDENTVESQHGGKRSGAGRPRGSVNRRTSALREAIEAEGVDPAIALVRIGKAAEARAVAVTDLLGEVMAKAAEAGVVTEDADQEITRKLAEARAELSLAAECYGKVLPFVHAKPRTSADAHPEEALEFAKAMLTAKISAAAETLESPGLAERLARAKQRASVTILMSTGIDRSPDDPIIDITPTQPAQEARHSAPAPSAGPAPAQATDAPPAPAPEPYRPILPREAPPPPAADWSAPPAPWPERQARAEVDYNPFSAEPHTGGLLGSRNT
jgi:hypothetical protein